MKTPFTGILLTSLLLTSCYDDGGISPPIRAYYEPIYGQVDVDLSVKQEAARQLSKPGRIYVKGNMLLVVEQHLGIHVIDNTNPEDPKNLAFISVPGATNLAVYNNHLYTNNLTDLVTLDIQDMANIHEVGRVANALEPFTDYPPYTNVAFRCVEPGKGVVVGWRAANWPENEPECRR